MQSNYSNRDFEQYVKQHADEYRMFPSEKVWKGVHGALHTRRRWSGLGLAFLLLLTGGAVTWVMTIYPSSSRKQDIANIKPGPVQPGPAEQPRATTEAAARSSIQDLVPFDQAPPGGNDYNEILQPDFLTPGTINTLTEDAPAPRNNMILAGSPAIAPVYDLPTQQAPISVFTGLPQLPTGIFGTSEPTHQADAIEASPNTEWNGPIAPYTIESVVNTYKHQQPRKKINWQVYVTPTISYRKLSVNKSFDNNSGVGYPFASLTDVNKAVTHKPDLGLQLGIAARYPLTRAIKVRGGVQFNINRYDIKAFAYNGEVATINLNSTDGSGNTSISTWTRYRNFGGYRSDWLKNYYFTVSLPFGAEVRLGGNDRSYFGMAGTIQPTYIISDRAYLLSTDYKNYASVPGLIRHVNVSTGFEAFVNYTKGKTSWQIGPQVRYQMLSSFHNKYPVKENLFDFGVKVGVSVNK